MSKFADAVVTRFVKGKPDPKMSDKDAGESETTEDEDTSDDKPGMKGKMLAAALKKGDGEAIEEAVKAICG